MTSSFLLTFYPDSQATEIDSDPVLLSIRQRVGRFVSHLPLEGEADLDLVPINPNRTEDLQVRRMLERPTDCTHFPGTLRSFGMRRSSIMRLIKTS